LHLSSPESRQCYRMPVFMRTFRASFVAGNKSGSY
jgi:hypothetical protein